MCVCSSTPRHYSMSLCSVHSVFSKDSCDLAWEYLECLCTSLHSSLIGLEPAAIHFSANGEDNFFWEQEWLLKIKNYIKMHY